MYPLVALIGLLLATWALIKTPDDLRGGRDIAQWSSSQDGTLLAIRGRSN
jgi:hypothetical protein